jgi:hypothetical protein
MTTFLEGVKVLYFIHMRALMTSFYIKMYFFCLKCCNLIVMHGKENKKFMITSTMTSQWNLPWARWLKSKYSHFIYSRFILTPFSQLRLGQGWRTYGTCAQNVTRKNFLGTRHSLLSHFFILPDQRLRMCRTCAHIHITDCVQTVQ